MRVVIDTNVIISRFLSPSGSPARVLALWEDGRFEAVVSEPILAEYDRVLAYPKIAVRLGLTSDEIAQTVADFRAFAVVIEPADQVTVIADDPSDNMFLEAAIAGSCDYVVSGDPHLLRVGEYRGIPVLTPAAFLAVVQDADLA